MVVTICTKLFMCLSIGLRIITNYFIIPLKWSLHSWCCRRAAWCWYEIKKRVKKPIATVKSFQKSVSDRFRAHYTAVRACCIQFTLAKIHKLYKRKKACALTFLFRQVICYKTFPLAVVFLSSLCVFRYPSSSYTWL